ncbi:MAG: hypothetical protein ACI4KL_01925 [Lentihominibacter sp.]
MRKESSVPVPKATIGISSLLVVFIVLCLVTFACLSLSTARSDFDFAEKNAARKTAYYNACNEAEALISDSLSGKSEDTSWAVPIDDKSELQVEIEIGSGGSYTIRSWQVVPTVKHDYNQNMNLIK